MYFLVFFFQFVHRYQEIKGSRSRHLLKPLFIVSNNGASGLGTWEVFCVTGLDSLNVILRLPAYLFLLFTESIGFGHGTSSWRSLLSICTRNPSMHVPLNAYWLAEFTESGCKFLFVPLFKSLSLLEEYGNTFIIPNNSGEAADPNWPKGYSISHGLMGERRKEGQGGTFGVMALVFPSNHYMW